LLVAAVVSEDMAGKEVAVDSSSSGDYKSEFMRHYAPDYQKYTAGSSEPADYRKYMSHFAGDYNKYMGGKNHAKQGAGYQKFADQYSGDYQRYYKKGASQGSDYQKYMEDYQKYNKAAPTELLASGREEAHDRSSSSSSSGGGSGGSSKENEKKSGQGDGGWEQRYGEYEQEYAAEYMPEVKNASDPRVWEDAFVKKYAEPYRRYIEAHDRMAKEFPNAPSSASACHSLEQLKEWHDAQHEMIRTFVPSHYRSFSYGAIEQEYRVNRARIEKEEKAAKARAASEAKANATAKATAKEKEKEEEKTKKPPPSAEKAAVPVAPELLIADFAAPETNLQAAGVAASRPGEARKWTSEYAHNYAPLPDEPSDWADWRRRFVGKFAGPYRKYVEDSHRLARQYHTTPIRAEDASTMAELRRWRDAQNAQIDTFIPQAYSHFVAGAVEQKYEENKARIERELARQDAAKKAEEAKGDEAAKKETKAKKAEEAKGDEAAKKETKAKMEEAPKNEEAREGDSKEEEVKKEAEKEAQKGAKGDRAKGDVAKEDAAADDAAEAEKVEATKPKASGEVGAAPMAFLSPASGIATSAPSSDLAFGLVLAMAALLAMFAAISFSFVGVVRQFLLFRGERALLREQLLGPPAPLAA